MQGGKACSGVLIAFPHRDQVFLSRSPRQYPRQIVEKDHRRRNPEYESGGIEKQPDRYAGRGCAVMEGQNGLLPAADRQQPVRIEHQGVAHDEAKQFAAPRQRAHQRVDPEVRVLSQGDDRPQEGKPDQKPAGEFLRGRDAGVECVPQHDIGEDQNDHGSEAERNHDFQDAAIEIDPSSHGHFPAHQLVLLRTRASSSLKSLTLAGSYSPENFSITGLVASCMRACSAGGISLNCMPLAVNSASALSAASLVCSRWYALVSANVSRNIFCSSGESRSQNFLLTMMMFSVKV